MRKVVTLVCLLLVAQQSLRAQWQDSLPLAEVNITANRFNRFNVGQKTATIDSLQVPFLAGKNLADVLSEQTQVFVKNYGPGNIASLSFRGTGAEHTAVLWNGFNLQSPMLGQVDVSIIPISAGDELSIQYGGNGALYGSGVIGGALQLNSAAGYNSGLQASLGLWAGSFNQFKQVASLQFGNKKWFTSLKLLNQNNQNNFPYYNTSLAGSPLQNQTHAAFKQQSAILENDVKLSDHQEFNIRLWYQKAERDIAPIMSVPVSDAEQSDEAIRTTAEWKLKQKKHLLAVRTALFNEHLHYRDESKNIYNRNRFNTHITEAEFAYNLSDQTAYIIGINNTFNTAQADTVYNKTMNRFAQFASLKWHSLNNKFAANASLRTELLHATFLPVIPAFGFEWNLNTHWRFYGQVNRSYRVPTFNELYWNPGGNPNLKPESSWGEELSVAYHGDLRKIKLGVNMTAFNRNVHNWILWLPVTSTYWSPQNILEVWNRGLETQVHIEIPVVTQWKIKLQSAFNYTPSTILNDGPENGNQLPYIPRITQQYQAGIAHRSFSISYLHQYTGMRFGSSDNTVTTDDYQLANLKVTFYFKLFKTGMQILTECNNLWNASYVVMPDRPMPLRNYLFGLNITL